MKSIRRTVSEVLGINGFEIPAARVFGFFILGLIALNIIAIAAETVEELYAAAPVAFRWFEVASITIFSIEYLLRLWACIESKQGRSPRLTRVRYALSPLMLVDLVAILPFYIPFLGLDLRVLRILRLLRLFRVAKAARYSRSLQTLGRVISSKKEELFITVYVLLLLIIVSSSLMYYAEHEAQPDSFQNIPATIWWAVITLTTVGYGDVYPITVAGKALASFIAIFGIGMFALPTGIVGAGFVEEIGNRKKEKPTCPHCGAKL